MIHCMVFRRGDGVRGEDDLPLVETGEASSTSSVYCRTTSCVDDPQKTALEALLSGNMRLLSDLLAEESITVDTEKQYPDQGSKTLLHVAVENKNSEAVRILLAGGAQLGHFNNVLKVTVLHLAAGQGEEGETPETGGGEGGGEAAAQREIQSQQTHQH